MFPSKDPITEHCTSDNMFQTDHRIKHNLCWQEIFHLYQKTMSKKCHCSFKVLSLARLSEIHPLWWQHKDIKLLNIYMDFLPSPCKVKNYFIQNGNEEQNVILTLNLHSSFHGIENSWETVRTRWKLQYMLSRLWL